jgi:hypothetical protein
MLLLMDRKRSSIARGALVAAALVAVLITTSVPPAGAEVTVVPRDASLSTSASCSQGDIELDYSATGAERQITDFTSADGRELHHYDVRVYSANHEKVEFILSQTRQPPPAGSIVAVHVTIGTSPPDAKSAEFIVAYRCDTTPNDAGGKNEVMSVCTGMYGTCPITAKQVVDGPPAATSDPPPPPLMAAAAPPSPAPPVVKRPLSRTGADVAGYLQVAGVLVLVGAILVAAAWRRRHIAADAARTEMDSQRPA